MSYEFHNLTHIILAYLDDLTTRSKKCHDHLSDLHIIFYQCRIFNISLNPLKCVSCVPVDHLLGFVVSKQGIQVDPLKVHTIVELPPPHTYQQLQSLQGKVNLLRHFFPDYATQAHGLLQLLWQDIPFWWDEFASSHLKPSRKCSPLHRSYIHQLMIGITSCTSPYLHLSSLVFLYKKVKIDKSTLFTTLANNSLDLLSIIAMMRKRI